MCLRNLKLSYPGGFVFYNKSNAACELALLDDCRMSTNFIGWCVAAEFAAVQSAAQTTII